jgi:ABC-type multidrug transport system fused ATPase/permease subunit
MAQNLNPLGFYEQELFQCTTTLNTLKKRINAISVARFIAALCLCASGYFALYGGLGISFAAWIIAFGAFMLTFAILVTYHARLFSKQQNMESLKKVFENECKVLRGDWAHIPDGIAFLNHRELSQSADYALDLDIFGKASLYQRINRTVTPQGAQRLAECLVTPLLTSSDIAERQRALEELAERTRFRHAWQAAEGSKMLGAEEVQLLQKWLQSEGFVQKHVFMRVVMVLFPLVFLSGLGLILLNFHSELGMKILWGGFIANMLTAAIFLQQITREASLVQHFVPLLAVSARLFGVMKTHNAEQAFVHSAPRRMNACAEEALREIRALAQLMRRFDDGTSLAGALLLNGTLLWNLHCAAKMERWRKRNAPVFAEWMQSLAEMDALVSLAGFVFHHPTFVNPSLCEVETSANTPQTHILRAYDMGHPFLADTECVRSSISFDAAHGQVCIVTGANMAGKSTFLRALGLNTVLAMIGLPVNAQSFECSGMKILTSMRTTDSLERHESYFFAELQRLRMIVEHLKHSAAGGNGSTLVLLDEILRGTNSADKKSGTIGLLRKFIASGTPTVIATHDTDVGHLEQEYPDRVRNFCFEGVISGGELSFDYKLRSGIAANKNATFLMQKMGIIDATV